LIGRDVSGAGRHDEHGKHNGGEEPQKPVEVGRHNLLDPRQVTNNNLVVPTHKLLVLFEHG